MTMTTTESDVTSQLAFLTLLDGAAAAAPSFVPKIRSGSHADIGKRRAMEDEHIQIDNFESSTAAAAASFYAVFDGHGGRDAASYLKHNAARFFFYGDNLLRTTDVKESEKLHRDAFLSADCALSGSEAGVSASCGATAITALVLGNRLLVANAGDSRAVLCRDGRAIDMSNDHKTTYEPELKRVEEAGGFVEDGYLNGLLAVTRSLGDREIKSTTGALIAEPEIIVEELTEKDEFLIMACDGVWDVVSSQNAVGLVRRGLRRHDDPEECARALVKAAIDSDTADNVTAIVICLATPSRVFEPRRGPPRFHRGNSSLVGGEPEGN